MQLELGSRVLPQSLFYLVPFLAAMRSSARFPAPLLNNVFATPDLTPSMSTPTEICRAGFAELQVTRVFAQQTQERPKEQFLLGSQVRLKARCQAVPIRNPAAIAAPQGQCCAAHLARMVAEVGATTPL